MLVSILIYKFQKDSKNDIIKGDIKLRDSKLFYRKKINFYFALEKKKCNYLYGKVGLRS